MPLAHFTIATTDAPATARFYQQIFSWQPIRMPENIDVEAIWLDIGRGQQLHVLQVERFEVSPFEEEFGRHFAFFFSSAEMATIRQRLSEQGIPIIPPIRPTPFPRFFFRDPIGYMWELINQDRFVAE